MFLENEKNPILATVLFSLYKEEFLAVGGTPDDIDNYTIQNIILKGKEQFEDICIDKLSNKSGNVIFPSSLTLTDTIALLNKSNDKDKEIRHAAMALRIENRSKPPSNIRSLPPISLPLSFCSFVYWQLAGRTRIMSLQ